MEPNGLIVAVDRRNRRTASALVLLVAAITLYSLWVIKTRGQLPEPKNLTPLQRIWRGL